MRSPVLLILAFEILLVQDAGRLAAAAERTDFALVRVRSENPSIAARIRDATGWSTTFRGLIETIAATDGLVYVEEGTCGHGVRACLVLSVKVARDEYRVGGDIGRKGIPLETRAVQRTLLF